MAHRWVRSLEDRLWEKIDKRGPGECWEWQASRSRAGYGYLKVGNGNKVAHRVAYELAVGRIPSGLIVMHSCDNPPCCNPSHLSLGTTQDNADDKMRKGRWYSPRLVGEDARSSKLKCVQVLAIRATYAQGGTSQHQLAAEYGVCQMTISKIVRRETWQEI